MGFVKKAWSNRLVEFAGRRKLTIVAGSIDSGELIVDVKRNEGMISQEGDAFSAENMDNLEERIANGFGIELTGTLKAGQTTISFTNTNINNDSIFDFYANVFGVNPTGATVDANTLKLTFDVQKTDLEVIVVIKEMSKNGMV